MCGLGSLSPEAKGPQPATPKSKKADEQDVPQVTKPRSPDAQSLDGGEGWASERGLGGKVPARDAPGRWGAGQAQSREVDSLTLGHFSGRQRQPLSRPRPAPRVRLLQGRLNASQRLCSAPCPGTPPPPGGPGPRAAGRVDRSRGDRGGRGRRGLVCRRRPVGAHVGSRRGRTHVWAPHAPDRQVSPTEGARAPACAGSLRTDPESVAGRAQGQRLQMAVGREWTELGLGSRTRQRCAPDGTAGKTEPQGVVAPRATRRAGRGPGRHQPPSRPRPALRPVPGPSCAALCRPRFSRNN